MKQQKGLRRVGRTLEVLFHRLEVTLTVLNDVGSDQGQTTQEEFSSSGNPGISSHRGPGTVPVEQPQQAVPPGLSGGNDGGGLGALPGYAEFVTLLGQLWNHFLQNMAQVVGEQTAQIPLLTRELSSWLQ